MSAPKAGRQSPPLSAQNPSQGESAPSSGKASSANEQAGERETKTESERQLEALPSNPSKGETAMGDKADVATGKKGRGVEN